MTTDRPINLRSILHWWWRAIEAIRWSLGTIIFLGVLRMACTLAFVWVSRTLIDTAVSANASKASLVWMSVALAALMLGQTIFGLVSQYIGGKDEIKLKNGMRRRLFSRLLSSRWIERQNLHSGDLLSRLTEDVRVVGNAIAQRLPQAITMGLQFVGAFAFLCFLSWKLALCVVGITPLFIALSKIYVRRTRKLTSEIRSHESEMQVTMQESIKHQMLVQTLEAEDEVEREFDSTQSWLMSITLYRQRFSVFSRGCMNFGFVACFLTAFLWSVWHLHTGVITFGTMAAFLQLVARLQNPIVNVAQQIPTIVQAVTSAERLMGIEGLPSEGKYRCIDLGSPLGVRVSNLEFSYPNGNRKIFDDFSYDFKPGSRTVLMGPTGVGKSTVTKLILGLLVPDKGEITIYNQEEGVKAEANADTRCNIAYVPQGNSLLSGTIRDNLLLANPDATDEDIRDALYIADAGFVYDLPLGLETECRESAATLSEGQAQRIAIARALLRNKSILILDEFNSSLDADTADRIMHRLMDACPSVTMIFISHRPEILKYCRLCQLSPQ